MSTVHRSFLMPMPWMTVMTISAIPWSRTMDIFATCAVCTDTSYCGAVQWGFTVDLECAVRKDRVEFLTEIDWETVPYTECKLYFKVQLRKRPKFVWKEYENYTCDRKCDIHFKDRLHVKHTTKYEEETKYDCTTEWLGILTPDLDKTDNCMGSLSTSIPFSKKIWEN